MTESPSRLTNQAQYKAISRWLAEVGALLGVAEASNIEHCKQGYFGRNGNEIVPLGPER